MNVFFSRPTIDGPRPANMRDMAPQFAHKFNRFLDQRYGRFCMRLQPHCVVIGTNVRGMAVPMRMDIRDLVEITCMIYLNPQPA